MSLYDVAVKKHFLIDSGADTSVYPASKNTKFKNTSQPFLVAANGSPIGTYGKIDHTILLDNGRKFTHTFWLADVKKPILGADFFIRHKLSIDLANKRLIRSKDGRTTNLEETYACVPGICNVKTDQFKKLFLEFKCILQPNFAVQPKHKVQHHIITSGAPVYSKARRLSTEKFDIAKKRISRA